MRRKLAAVIVALALVFGLASSASAEDAGSGLVSISVENVASITWNSYGPPDVERSKSISCPAGTEVLTGFGTVYRVDHGAQTIARFAPDSSQAIDSDTWQITFDADTVNKWIVHVFATCVVIE